MILWQAGWLNGTQTQSGVSARPRAGPRCWFLFSHLQSAVLAHLHDTSLRPEASELTPSALWPCSQCLLSLDRALTLFQQAGCGRDRALLPRAADRLTSALVLVSSSPATHWDRGRRPCSGFPCREVPMARSRLQLLP